MENTELMLAQQGGYVVPIVTIEDAKNKFEQVRKYTANCLTKGVDYGNYAGVAKPSLLKPGAEKIGSLFGLAARFECIDKVLNFTGEGNPDNEPFFYFEYRCSLYKGENFVGSCEASCNSWEKKYRYRKGGLICPDCGKQAVMVSKYGGYYCNAKNGGCGHKFKENDPRITNQSVGEQKNFDTAEQVNTFQKMAQKRAYIGAILIVCNLSEYFTQDIEDMDGMSISRDPDMVEGEYTEVHQAKPVEEKKKWDDAEFLRTWTEKATVLVGKINIPLPDISLDMAMDIDTTNKDGSITKMGDCRIGQLAGMWKAYKARLEDPNVDQENILMKLSAVNKILTTRKAQKGL